MKLNQLTEENIKTKLDDELFNKEKFVKEFIYEYRKLYMSLKEAIDNIYNSDQNVHNEFKKHKVNINDFSKILLGQIV
ncbi:MAG TPA: hypothetical protein PK222_09745, partial [Bacteroidales bacterium]|nr:hypothetical protein [Bacteroidales bacterium]